MSEYKTHPDLLPDEDDYLVAAEYEESMSEYDLDDDEYVDPTKMATEAPLSMLQMARQAARLAEIFDSQKPRTANADDEMGRAVVFATIAQAEALTRIADALELSNMADHHIKPKGNHDQQHRMP